MKSVVTIRLDEDLEALLDRYCRMSGKTRSEVIREATRRQLQVFMFDALRQRIMPLAEARGIAVTQQQRRPLLDAEVEPPKVVLEVEPNHPARP